MTRRIIFIHQNAPGQFRHLLAHCARDPAYEVVVIGEKRRVVANFRRALPRVKFHVYEVEDLPVGGVPQELWTTSNAMRRGRAVALCLKNVRDAGFKPDVIYGHPGWGEMLHVRDVFPEACIATYCEFYFNQNGQDLNFDREFQVEVLDSFRVRTDNMTQLASLVDADISISPTLWQRSRYPEVLRQRIKVIHDGIDLDSVKPDPSIKVQLPGTVGTLDRSVPVITYVSRNLEPYRGFPGFMRALPEILRRLPSAQVLIVGGDEVSYSRQLAEGMTYRQLMLAELGAQLDLSRVHFLGRLPYAQYLRILQLSTVHVYLTYPFVLSWSVLEAMATGSVVVGSRTAPVEEVISDGTNGYLVDFFSHQQLADAVCRACVSPRVVASMRQAAMGMVAQRFNLKDCLSRQLDELFQGVNRDEIAQLSSPGEA
jgi:glycosyltransferase involved in cell wall biosynthesis